MIPRWVLSLFLSLLKPFCNFEKVVEWQRMEAVKRAYAEIILNTAAESAARILASERKAMGLQRSLATTKQDAVDMMLRLKSLMDSKINEAETRNLLHARRIQELIV
ncbi:hypothetical protein FCM35_KLT17076 [Carex littledalei]|uniref:Uncharacterized protein n=1 Tax=Carex littledalei TaxID=544730 RepID=A0A833RQC1_9POAL|nr:hypothetical protein FCM35_KLT17076 [Carex littledalei]